MERGGLSIWKNGDNSILVTVHSFMHSQVFIHHVYIDRTHTHSFHVSHSSSLFHSVSLFLSPSSPTHSTLSPLTLVRSLVLCVTPFEMKLSMAGDFFLCLFAPEKYHARDFSSKVDVPTGQIMQLKTYLIKTNASKWNFANYPTKNIVRKMLTEYWVDTQIETMKSKFKPNNMPIYWHNRRFSAHFVLKERPQNEREGEKNKIADKLYHCI